MTEERQTVAGAYAKIDTHEQVCAERARSIQTQLRAIFGILGAAAMVAASGGGWAFTKVWDGQQEQLKHLQYLESRAFQH